MANKEITPKDPQATEGEAKDEREEADRKSQAARFKGRMSGRKTSVYKSGR